MLVARHPELSRGHGEGEHDDRGDDAVVQAALHVERAPDAQGEGLVVDDLRTQGCIRRGESRPDETGERPGEVVKEPRGREAAQDHGQGESDAEEA